MIDVEALRAQAHGRAASRAPIPFSGRISDEVLGGVAVRDYRPVSVRPDQHAAVFLHGGYGLFGDLSLQDSWCRRLASFDPAQTEGPDLATLRFAIRAWLAESDLTRAPRLHLSAAGLPPALIAVGSRDSLASEAKSLARCYQRANIRCELVEIAGAGHGFVSEAPAAAQVITAAAAFFATPEASRG